MMRTIYGNILDIETGIICHQVNCKRVAGAGLALQIRNKWPKWYRHFLAHARSLGQIDICGVQLGPEVWVVSLYAQVGYGHGMQTDYKAFRECLRLTKALCDFVPIYLPHGIGCGLAGGDWPTVLQIIEEELPQAILVKLPACPEMDMDNDGYLGHWHSDLGCQ